MAWTSDSKAATYPVLFHVGDAIDIRTQMQSGRLRIEDGTFAVNGRQPLVVPLRDLSEVELFRLNGVGRMIRVHYGGKTVFLTVYRVNLFGYFAFINFFATGELAKSLRLLASPAR